MFNRRKGWGKVVALCLTLALLLGPGGLMMPDVASAAATTSLTITKLASDGTTVLEQKTVNYHWLEDPNNIPVMGDGTTHYYHQGPVFIDDPDEEKEQELRWNKEEDTNVETKDMGAVMGTNVKDLCDLVGGMEAGDELKIDAVDGFSKCFAYKNVYEYSDREGPMVICWYNDGKYPDSGYLDGMRLVWFADNSINPWGSHVFGNWDWHEAATSKYWHYYQQNDEKYPATTGLSVQTVSKLTIYSSQAPPQVPTAAFSTDLTSGTAPLTIQFTDESTNSPNSWEWDFDNNGVVDSTEQNPTYEYNTAGTYSVKLTVTNAAGSDDEVKVDYITVTAAGPKTLYVDSSGSANFTTIQAAVTAASDGDTIIVKDGTYTENVTVDKSLTIQSENGAASTIVKAAATNSPVFGANANGVVIDGFSVQGPTDYSGIELVGVNDCTIQNNECSEGCYNGIHLGETSSNNTITMNYCHENTRRGISVRDSANGNFISKNTVENNGDEGFCIKDVSKNNVLWLNNIMEPVDIRSVNTYNSVDQITYTYNGSTYIGYLGNYWKNYAGTDVNGDGVGDSPYTFGSYSDNYPLMVQSTSYKAAPPSQVPTAAFTTDLTSGTAPLTIQFTDESTNSPNSWEWDFDNNGVVDSTEQNPTYEYNTAGTYSVKLTVTNASGSDDEVKIDYITVAESATIDVLYDGTVTLTPNETFEVTAYNSDVSYTINKTTPLGALNAAAAASGFTYDVTDKNYEASGALLLDNVGTYARKAPGKWYAYVNDVYKDGYNNKDGALNLIVLKNEDKVEFYYAADISDPTDLCAVKAAAAAAVKTMAAVQEPSTIDVLYDGTVTLTPDETFTVTAYNSQSNYTVNKTTPLGALQAAATASGFTYDVTDKNYEASGALLLDNVGTYARKAPGKWYAYVNDVYKDGYNNKDGALNLIVLKNGDKVEFYYAADISDPTDLCAVKAAAAAAVKTVASTGASPDDWTLQLSGAKNTSISKKAFEGGLDCTDSGHKVSWTDDDDNVWGGIPLWLLVAMVDDDPDLGSFHVNFNDELAEQHYEVNVIANDWKATLDSADIARNDGYIVANTLNGNPLPLKTEAGKSCWPLHLKGSAVLGGKQVGGIVRIELTGLPAPSEGWTLEMMGDVGDTITQEEFETGLTCTGSDHLREWTDKDGNKWSGVPLWVLLGAVDDIETSTHWTFNDNLAANYSVKVSAADFSKTFDGADVAKNDNYIVANKCNGQPLVDSGPLRLVGNGVTKTDGSLGGSSVGSIVKIEIPELQTPTAEPGNWNLTLNGKISDVISKAEFEDGLTCHLADWIDKDGNKWSGIPLWLLTGWVDDRQPHDYNANQAMAGYTVLVKAEDYMKDFASKDIAQSSNYIIANRCNDDPLEDSWPLRLVGAGVANDDGSLGGRSVGKVTEIELTSFQAVQPVPEVHIIKYAEDRTTILNEKTVDYQWMQGNLDVIGDGTTVYRFEGITNNPDDVWDKDETYPGGYKIENAVKGTRIKDLCELVGGMGTGTEIKLIAKDGFETTLPYSSIYTDPAVQARQGDAILAWYADGKYVPDYRDGMRVFFTPDGDNVYGQWDMHETLPSNYWHYHYAGEVQYPSCAGLSAKLISEIKIYSTPQKDWTLKLDGRDIGGWEDPVDVSKTYFDKALSCQFGANHKASYTDSKNRVWEGMPLWFLVGYVDDENQHKKNAFNDALAAAGYQVVITAADGHSVTIDSADIIRNNDYIIANSLNGAHIPDTDRNWPLRLVGSAVSGATSISQIVSIKLEPVSTNPLYTVAPVADSAYIVGTTSDGINTMTVNTGITGFKYFTVNVTPIAEHSGNEAVVFTHLRDGVQISINVTKADFDDQVSIAQAGFNVEVNDVIKAYIVDDLTNSNDVMPVILQ